MYIYYFLKKIGVDTAENEPSEIWLACPGPSLGRRKQPRMLLVLQEDALLLPQDLQLVALRDLTAVAVIIRTG